MVTNEKLIPFHNLLNLKNNILKSSSKKLYKSLNKKIQKVNDTIHAFSTNIISNDNDAADDGEFYYAFASLDTRGHEDEIPRVFSTSEAKMTVSPTKIKTIEIYSTDHRRRHVRKSTKSFWQKKKNKAVVIEDRIISTLATNSSIDSSITGSHSSISKAILEYINHEMNSNPNSKLDLIRPLIREPSSVENVENSNETSLLLKHENKQSVQEKIMENDVDEIEDKEHSVKEKISAIEQHIQEQSQESKIIKSNKTPSSSITSLPKHKTILPTPQKINYTIDYHYEINNYYKRGNAIIKSIAEVEEAINKTYFKLHQYTTLRNPNMKCNVKNDSITKYSDDDDDVINKHAIQHPLLNHQPINKAHSTSTAELDYQKKLEQSESFVTNMSIIEKMQNRHAKTINYLSNCNDDATTAKEQAVIIQHLQKEIQYLQSKIRNMEEPNDKSCSVLVVENDDGSTNAVLDMMGDNSLVDQKLD